MKSLNKAYAVAGLMAFHAICFAQAPDTAQKWNFHFQETVITQYHGTFNADYSGYKSLTPEEETKTSLTSTLFLGLRTWKNGAIYFNPEISGGAGFSGVQGIAGFTNGEIYRVGSPAPVPYVARIYVEQTFNLGEGRQTVESEANQLGRTIDSSRVRLVAGKFCLADFFDDNAYSHDPRTQFLNWSLMSNGAWDYPANTKGYTWGFMAELVKKNYAIRFAGVLVPTEANGSEMDMKISQAHGLALEIEKKYFVFKKQGTLKIFGFNNLANMGNYRESINNPGDSIDITTTRKYSRTKYGFGLSIEQPLGEHIGLFARAGWNDGHNETWAFTEIDQSFSLGVVVDGSSWKRAGDRLGLAIAVNGISNDHSDYLAAGGYGFIIGDSKLVNYGAESVFETYYSFQLEKTIYISPDYQFVLNPAYNKDRGPVSAFGLRVHLEL